MSKKKTANDPGTRFPFVNLKKAVSRAKDLYEADMAGRPMLVTAAFDVWKYSGKSSGGFQTIAALKAYGLIDDTGGGEGRKVGLTSDALKYFKDEREEERVKLLKQFARKPPMLAALWGDWGGTPPADTVARSHLKIDRNLNEQSARALLTIYKDNMAYADLKGDDKVAGHNGESDDTKDETDDAKIGDFIQWTNNGADQFKQPRRVEWVSDDGSYLRVFGSPTGIPMSEATVVDPPAPQKPSGAPTPEIPDADGNDINVYLTGSRLQITADVDGKGLDKLKKVLAKYDEILKMLQ